MRIVSKYKDFYDYLVQDHDADITYVRNIDVSYELYDKLYNDLIESGIPMSENKPFIEYNCGSLHVYDRHFKHLEN